MEEILYKFAEDFGKALAELQDAVLNAVEEAEKKQMKR